MVIITGQCHCGNIDYQLHWPTPARELRGRACGCGYCQRQGAVWTSDPHAHLDVIIRQAAQVSHYHFGHSTATFHLCAICGVVPFASCEPDNHLAAVTNINTFTSLEPRTVQHEPSDFEGETSQARLARRRRNWTPLRISAT